VQLVQLEPVGDGRNHGIWLSFMPARCGMRGVRLHMKGNAALDDGSLNLMATVASRHDVALVTVWSRDVCTKSLQPANMLNTRCMRFCFSKCEGRTNLVLMVATVTN